MKINGPKSPEKNTVVSRSHCKLCDWQQWYEDDASIDNEELNGLHKKEFEDHLKTHGVGSPLSLEYVGKGKMQFD